MFLQLKRVGVSSTLVSEVSDFRVLPGRCILLVGFEDVPNVCG